MMTDFAIIGLALTASLAGLLLCWRAWRKDGLTGRAFWPAIPLWSIATALWIWRFGPEIGIALALETARGAVRLLTAGLLGFAAAMGLALLFATRAPLAEQTRLILAGLAVPSLWCIAIAWTVCSRRLPLQIATFLVLALGGAGLTFLTA
jgi:hypothetical protein